MIEKRMEGVNLREEMNKWIDNYYKDNQLNKKKDEVEEEEEEKPIVLSELVKRTEKTGDLKRKVGDEIQGDLPLLTLSKEQKENCEIEEETAAVKRRKAFGGMMRNAFETVIEWIAVADFITDMLVLFQISQTEHHAWTTITLFSMLAPFFACQTPFLMFLKEQVYRDKDDRFKLKFLSEVMVSPFMLVYMFLMDIVFLVNQAILVPIIQVLRLLTCNLINLSCLTQTIDNSYEILFEMQKLEVAGFRRMRTISQLTFETFIQFILQMRMLSYFSNKKDKASHELGVSVSAIIFSLFLAVIHGIFEAAFLFMEA